jgi:hypothetical protein
MNHKQEDDIWQGQALSLRRDMCKCAKLEHNVIFGQQECIKFFVTLLITGRWLHVGFQMNQMNMTDRDYVVYA